MNSTVHLHRNTVQFCYPQVPQTKYNLKKKKKFREGPQKMIKYMQMSPQEKQLRRLKFYSL